MNELKVFCISAFLLFTAMPSIVAQDISVEERIRRADVLIIRERYVEASDMLNQALILDTSSVNTKMELAKLYMLLGDNEAALNLFYDLAIAKPDDYLVAMQIGKLQMELELYNLAENSLFQSIRMEKANPIAYYYLAKSYQTQDRYDKAIEYFEKCIEYIPGFQDAYERLGQSYYKTQNYEQALKYMQLSIDGNTDNAEKYLEKALVYFDMEQYADAISETDKAIDIDGLNSYYHYWKGYAHHYLKQDSIALKELNDAINFNAYVDKYYYVRGFIQLSLKDFGAACHDFNRSADLGNLKAIRELEVYCHKKRNKKVLKD